MPKKLDLTDNLEKYIIDHSEKLSNVQNEIIQHNISLGDQQRLQISISQAQFLQTLIKVSNVKKILEIGSFTGFSALSMAMAPMAMSMAMLMAMAMAMSRVWTAWTMSTA